MTEEFNLSEKIFQQKSDFDTVNESPLIEVEDVKEFIRRLKEKLCNCNNTIFLKEGGHCSNCNTIVKLAGDKLK